MIGFIVPKRFEFRLISYYLTIPYSGNPKKGVKILLLNYYAIEVCQCKSCYLPMLTHAASREFVKEMA